VLDRPLILLTTGEGNPYARLAQQPLRRGRITRRSPPPGRGRIVHVPTPLGAGPDDPRAAAVGLYYEGVPEALVVGGSDEAGMAAAAEDLLERLQLEGTADA
jgi:hypothetical protein